MIRDYIIKSACVLLLVGFTAGALGQIELLAPGILFLNEAAWSILLSIHAWATSIALGIICLSTISLIRHRIAAAQWAIWLGFAAVPLLIGLVSSVMLKNAGSPDSYLADTVYVTAARHAYGTAMLLVALGGLSAWQRLKFKTLPLPISLAFALLITASGVALTFAQSSMGLNGMPRRYLDYPQEFAQLSFTVSVAAITCFSLSMVYLILLWRCRTEESGKAENIF